MDIETSFGAWIRQRRRALDLTQEDLAQCVGYSISAVRKIESDQRRPSSQVAELMADVLQIDPADRATFMKVARGKLRVERLHQAAIVEQDHQVATYTSAHRNSNLPAAYTPLIGRESELTQLNHLLRDPQCRLLTLVGPGGIGKTRLALAAAAQQRDAFADGVYFVSLAPVRSLEFIVPAITNALRLTLQGTDDPKVELFNYLREKHMLLVLDNLEHLLPVQNGAAAEMLADLLARSGKLKLVATSRERLNLHAEWVVGIQGLPVPPGSDFDHLQDYSASALFLESARRSRVGYVPSPEEQRAIIRICELVDGMPLAIELAAAWIRTLSCVEIAQEIERNLDFLMASMRDVPERHRSVRAVFDHSWELLSEEERSVFQRLSVFRGGFDRNAAMQVADASLPMLAAFVDKSLLRRSDSGRYDFHELLRQYAHEHLAAIGELEHTQQRHLRYFVQVVEEAEPRITGSERAIWMDQLRSETDNLRGALEASQATDDDGELGLRLAGSIGWFWFFAGLLNEGRTWLQSALMHGKGVGRTLAKAKACSSLGGLAWSQGDFAAARLQLEESITICREIGGEASQPVLARSLIFLGFVCVNQGDHVAARAHHQESLSLSRQFADRWLEAITLSNLGDATFVSGDPEAARVLYQESLTIFQEVDDPWGRALVLYAIGSMALFQDHYAVAHTSFGESKKLFRDVGSRWGVARALLGLAGTMLCEGYLEGAASQYRESLIMGREVRNKATMTICLAGLGAIAAAQGKFERAAHLAGVVDPLRDKVGVRLWHALHVLYDRYMGIAREQSGDANWARMYAQGQAMSLEQAIDYALAVESSM